MPAMGLWESVRSLFGEGGNGCLPRIGKKESEDLYSYPVDHEKRKGADRAAAEEVVTVEVPEVPVRELNEITNSFSNENLIGQGSYAKVYRVLMRGARPAVVKKLEKPSKHASNVVFLKQLSVASRLKHENFVRLLGYTISGDLRVLVYEYAAMGTLHDVLHGPRDGQGWGGEAKAVVSWEQRVRIALDAARGLEYLHEKVQPAVTHKDVRSTNVLLFEGFRAKIADYNMFSQAADMARLNRSTHTLGSFGYQAPEYAMTGQMNDKSDVYSFGIVLLELLTGRKPLDRTLPQGQRSLVNWATPILTEDRVQDCIDPNLGDKYPPTGALKLGRIAVQCLQYDPTFRPSMGTVARVINYAVVRDQQGVV
ncbi:PTI1-like tyrosine-protein kinase 3 [Oryza glaberrima]|uniref:Protein kinase domain-containing protein n=1 Tax=Oryza glaberrima TaxID=4538 RepID=I1PMI6_ORYGL|nr:PTI1-like tyrosine-protein kinase 3 [Oryza glaberrima]